MGTEAPVRENAAGQQILVAVAINEADSGQTLSVDPWNNCPSETAKDEGQFCNECQFWGGEVEAIDWHEFSLCLFDDGH